MREVPHRVCPGTDMRGSKYHVLLLLLMKGFQEVLEHKNIPEDWHAVHSTHYFTFIHSF